MKPLEFYRLALGIGPHARSEQVRRTVVGRLYYGLHHEACCRYYRVNPGASPLRRKSRHACLAERFNQSKDAKSVKVALLLRRLVRFRVLADYELGQMYLDKKPLNAERLMNEATEVAKRLLVALDDYSPGEAQDGCNCPAT